MHMSGARTCGCQPHLGHAPPVDWWPRVQRGVTRKCCDIKGVLPFGSTDPHWPQDPEPLGGSLGSSGHRCPPASVGSTVLLLELAVESCGIGIQQDERPVCGSVEGSVRLGGCSDLGSNRCVVPQPWPSLAWPFHICGCDPRAGGARSVHRLNWLFEFFMVLHLRKGTAFH